MPYTKIQPQSYLASGEEKLLNGVFTIYGHRGNLTF